MSIPRKKNKLVNIRKHILCLGRVTFNSRETLQPEGDQIAPTILVPLCERSFLWIDSSGWNLYGRLSLWEASGTESPSRALRKAKANWICRQEGRHRERHIKKNFFPDSSCMQEQILIHCQGEKTKIQIWSWLVTSTQTGKPAIKGMQSVTKECSSVTWQQTDGVRASRNASWLTSPYVQRTQLPRKFGRQFSACRLRKLAPNDCFSFYESRGMT